jgi:hypothetical protein
MLRFCIILGSSGRKEQMKSDIQEIREIKQKERE